jgi:hypothetical protein
MNWMRARVRVTPHPAAVVLRLSELEAAPVATLQARTPSNATRERAPQSDISYCPCDSVQGKSVCLLASFRHVIRSCLALWKFLTITMSHMRKQEFRRYALALGATFIGAYLTEPTGSLLPLALGASALLLCTWTLVKAIWLGRS